MSTHITPEDVVITSKFKDDGGLQTEKITATLTVTASATHERFSQCPRSEVIKHLIEVIWRKIFGEAHKEIPKLIHWFVCNPRFMSPGAELVSALEPLIKKLRCEPGEYSVANLRHSHVWFITADGIRELLPIPESLRHVSRLERPIYRGLEIEEPLLREGCVSRRRTRTYSVRGYDDSGLLEFVEDYNF